MSVQSTIAAHVPAEAEAPVARGRIRSAWTRLPVLIRSVIVGFLVTAAASVPSGVLQLANVALTPRVPWSIPVIAIYLWFFWQYLGGRWSPRSTSDDRRQRLRARPLSSRVWRWALAAGGAALASYFALEILLLRLGLQADAGDASELARFPWWTVLSGILLGSGVAAVAEEAGFRGYMQVPIERRHGSVIAVLVSSAVFALAHMTHGILPTYVIGIFLISAALYGPLAHLTGSIVPGMILHFVGDACGFAAGWWLATFAPHPAVPVPQPATSPIASDPLFWLTLVEILVFAALSAVAYVRLARTAREERMAREPPAVVRAST
jgi:uncharacterized protein